MCPELVRAGAGDLQRATGDRLPYGRAADVAIHRVAAAHGSDAQRIDGTVVANANLSRLAGYRRPNAGDVVVDIAVALHGPSAIVGRQRDLVGGAGNRLPH